MSILLINMFLRGKFFRLEMKAMDYNWSACSRHEFQLSEGFLEVGEQGVREAVANVL